LNEKHTLTVIFPAASKASGNTLAASLEEAVSIDLSRARVDATAKRRRVDPEAQDFGASVALIFGAPAVVALAKALYTWLARNSGVSITLKTASGEVVAENLDSKDAAAVAAAISTALNRKAPRR
jgi:hypothetical protein